jgi:nitronate monooxygenase
VSLVDQLGLRHPIVQAGMGGGIATSALAGEVSAAGALGTVGIMPPEAFAAQLERARERAGAAPISGNLLIPFATREHVEACARARVEVVVLHAGFSRSLVERLRSGGALVLHTVGDRAQAKRALAEGADGLVVQGLEAGGHLMGTGPALSALTSVLELGAPGPVLVAGGIADASDVSRALAAGADAVVAGTRFLLTHESGAHPAYKQAVIGARHTIETQLFGLGWPMRHRVVPNAATERWCRSGSLLPRGLGMVQRLSTPMARLPMSLTGRLISAQRPRLPLFGPSAPLARMPDSVVDASALYAGESALRIESVISAAEAVRMLAGADTAGGSPTMRST